MLLAAGELTGPSIAQITQSQALQSRIGTVAALLTWRALKLQDKFYVLPGSQNRNQVIGLKDKAHVAQAHLGQLGCIQTTQIYATNDHTTGIKSVQTTNDVEQGRFARARGPRQADELTGVNGQIGTP